MAFNSLAVFWHALVCCENDTLQWRHSERDGVSNHQPHNYLFNRLFKRRTKKTSKLRVTGLCEGNSPVNSPHKGPVTQKTFPFDDAIMDFSSVVTYRTVTSVSMHQRLVVRPAAQGHRRKRIEWNLYELARISFWQNIHLHNVRHISRYIWYQVFG